jgi:hypothetical protein
MDRNREGVERRGYGLAWSNEQGGNQHLREGIALQRRGSQTGSVYPGRPTHQDEKATASRGHRGFQPVCTRQGHFVSFFLLFVFKRQKVSVMHDATVGRVIIITSSHWEANHDSFYLFLSFVVGLFILSLRPFPFGCPVCYIVIVCALPWSSSFCSVLLWLLRCLILFS